MVLASPMDSASPTRLAVAVLADLVGVVLRPDGCDGSLISSVEDCVREVRLLSGFRMRISIR